MAVSRRRFVGGIAAGVGYLGMGPNIRLLASPRAAFGVPGHFSPIGAISIGYSDEPPRDLSSRRKSMAQTVHRGRWNQPGA